MKAEERPPARTIIHASSDISEDDISFQDSCELEHFTYSQLLDQNPFKLLNIEINPKSEKMENDLYIYETKSVPGIKIKEENIVISREKLIN